MDDGTETGKMQWEVGWEKEHQRKQAVDRATRWLITDQNLNSVVDRNIKIETRRR